MTKDAKIHLHVSTLITNARQQLGYATLKELFREKQPDVDYQTWTHAESGRRVPSPAILILIGDALRIDREPLIMAYCRDKFDDERSTAALTSMDNKKFFDVEALLDAKDHDRSDDYIFSPEQIQAMQKDARLRLYLMYTYDTDLKTSIPRLAYFFREDPSEVRAIVANLQSMGLVDVDGEVVKKIHRHATLPAMSNLFDLRKKLILKSLDLNLKPDSIFSNYNVSISEKSYKKFLGFIEFALANLIRMNREDAKEMNNFRFEVAIACNKLGDGSIHEKPQLSLQQ